MWVIEQAKTFKPEQLCNHSMPTCNALSGGCTSHNANDRLTYWINRSTIPKPDLDSLKIPSCKPILESVQSQVAPSQAFGTFCIGIPRTVATHAWKQLVGPVCFTALGNARIGVLGVATIFVLVNCQCYSVNFFLLNDLCTFTGSHSSISKLIQTRAQAKECEMLAIQYVLLCESSSLVESRSLNIRNVYLAAPENPTKRLVRS